MSWEVSIARERGLDVRLFRKAHLLRSKVNSTHAQFIAEAEREGIVEVFTGSEDLAEKVKGALRLWLLDYWRLILETRKKRLPQADAACLLALAVAVTSAAGAYYSWWTVPVAAIVVVLCMVTSLFSLMQLE